jgi:putative oxidoreductase
VNVPDSWKRASDGIFRVLFSLIFAVAGLGHLLRPEAMVARLLDAPMADLMVAVAPATVLISATGVVLILGGVGLLLGVLTRVCALALLAVLVPITFTVHVGAPEHVGPLFKNIALLGGLIHFAAKGPGAFSLGSRPAKGTSATS